MPEVSVIIPTYHRFDNISPTISSVVDQSFSDLEIIIVNDGEDEKSLVKLIDSFNDSRIHYLWNQRKKGPNGARNTGFHNAKGRYIAFLDDDDRWYADKIQKQIQKFNESSKDTGVVYSGYEIISTSADGYSIKVFPQKKGKISDDIIRGNFIGSPTPLIIKDLFNSIEPYDENLKSAQDWDLWISLSEKTEFEYVDEILAVYVLHGGQISFDYRRKADSFDYITKKYSKLYNRHRRSLSTIYKRIAILLFMSGEIESSRKQVIKAFLTYCFRIDLPVHLILSFFPALYRSYIDNHFFKTFGEHKLLY